MSRILLDENLPVPMRRLFASHEVDHVKTLGWAGLANGRLIAAAEDAGYEIFVTADQNLAYQQNMTGRRIVIVVLSTNRWSAIQAKRDIVLGAVERAATTRHGSSVDLPLAGDRSRERR